MLTPVLVIFWSLFFAGLLYKHFPPIGIKHIYTQYWRDSVTRIMCQISTQKHSDRQGVFYLPVHPVRRDKFDNRVTLNAQSQTAMSLYSVWSLTMFLNSSSVKHTLGAGISVHDTSHNCTFMDIADFIEWSSVWDSIALFYSHGENPRSI